MKWVGGSFFEDQREDATKPEVPLVPSPAFVHCQWGTGTVGRSCTVSFFSSRDIPGRVVGC